jgi:putative ABC transport system permease protein
VSTPRRGEPLEAATLLRPYALVYLYSRRLRVHIVQELLAGLGVAIAVALVFAAMIANDSVAGSAGEVVREVVGPANLQMHARDADGLDQGLLRQVEELPGVEQAAPMLEQSATLIGAGGRRASVDLAGTSIDLVRLSGLARTLPVAVFSPDALGLSRVSADELGVSARTGAMSEVSLELRGSTHRLKVAAVLGREAAGALSQARVAVVPLLRLQRLAGLQGRLTRILVQARHGQEAKVRAELASLAGTRLTVAPIGAEVAQLRQALRPSDKASGFFAAISALLGFLFAFNAMLLTVPERRQAIADLRLIGTTRAAIVQIVVFQALCLGLVASFVGLLAGYALSLGAFHQSSGYLSEAFTIGTNTVVGGGPVALALLGGVLATVAASSVPLLDLRRRRALDAVYVEEAMSDELLGGHQRARLALSAAALVALATLLFRLRASLAFLNVGAMIAERYQRLTVLQVALTSLRAAPLRSLALAATGAVAIFGSIALGGSRDDLLRGIDGFSQSYAADAQLWIGTPDDNQATVPFHPDHYAARIAQLPGVAHVTAFQGGFLELGDRRTWIIARPPGSASDVLRSQIVAGDANVAIRRLGGRGWIVVSRQIAEEHHVRLGGALTLPTPSGPVPFRLAATTTNLAWSPGAIFISAGDYGRFWSTTLPTALGVGLAPESNAQATRSAIGRLLGPASGLEVSTAHTREARIDHLTSDGLRRLGEISTLLVVAAILAMAAALGSSIWQRRRSLAGLRLAGVRAPRLRRVLLTEAILMLGAGCLTGAVAGIYGEVIIDGYLRHVTGFPVSPLALSWRPFEVLALVTVVALVAATIPGWSASRVSPLLALDD